MGKEIKNAYDTPASHLLPPLLAFMCCISVCCNLMPAADCRKCGLTFLRYGLTERSNPNSSFDHTQPVFTNKGHLFLNRLLSLFFLTETGKNSPFLNVQLQENVKKKITYQAEVPIRPALWFFGKGQGYDTSHKGCQLCLLSPLPHSHVYSLLSIQLSFTSLYPTSTLS